MLPFHSFDHRCTKEESDNKIKECIKTATTELKKYEGKKKKWEQQLLHKPFVGRLLAICLLDTANACLKPCNGISKTALINKARGNPFKADDYYEDGKFAGMFKHIQPSEVEQMISDMRQNMVFHCESTYSSNFGYYDLYQPSDDAKTAIVWSKTVPVSSHKKKMTEYGWYCEIMKSHSRKSWTAKLELLEYTDLFDLFPEQFCAYFTDASEEISTYIRLMAKLETGKIKVVYQAVSKAITKSEQEKQQ